MWWQVAWRLCVETGGAVESRVKRGASWSCFLPWGDGRRLNLIALTFVMLNILPGKTGSSSYMLIWGVMMCFVFFLCLWVCAARGVFAFSFSGTIAFLLARSCTLRCTCPAPFRCPHGPPWRRDKLSGWAEVEDCRPGAPGPTASRVEVLLAPCASSLWWSLWNGLLAAEKKKARLIFWMCNTTPRTNSKTHSLKSHFP